MTDAELVKRSSQGDREAFVALVSRYRSSLAALIRRLAHDLDEAEDLLQDTLVQAWLKIATVREPERVQVWLLQIARNRCRDRRRSAARREQPTEERELEDYVNRYGRAAGPAPLSSEVEEAVGNLPPVEREVIELFYRQGLTIRDIAARSQSPVGTIKSRLCTARHHLRSLFGITDKEERKR